MARPLRNTPTDIPAGPAPPTHVNAPTPHARPLPHAASQRGAERSWVLTWRHWRAMLPAWLLHRRLDPDRARCHSAPFTAGVALRERHAALFDLRQAATGIDYPFLLGQGVVALLQARVLADLGLNRRRLRHLRHHTRWLSDTAVGIAVQPQQLACQLLRLVQVSSDEVLVQLQTRVTSPCGQPLAVVEDGFIAGGLSSADVQRAQTDDLLRRDVSRARRRTPEIDPGADGVLRRQLYIAADAGRRFGRLSGERGPAAARLAGTGRTSHRQAGMQPMYLHHLVARELAEWGVTQDSLQITFTGDAGLGHTLSLRLHGGPFELVDEQGRLVAYGKAA